MLHAGKIRHYTGMMSSSRVALLHRESPKALLSAGNRRRIQWRTPTSLQWPIPMLRLFLERPVPRIGK
jgi:hypothetical protein